MKIKYTVVFFMVLVSLNLFAQEKTEIKDLSIGDKVPNIKINKIINGDIRKAKINDFKDQLLILDLMHTKCGGCLQALPKMDSLQTQFGDKIKIMVVTFEKENDVEAFFKNFKKYKKLQIPWVVEDDILKEYFKYRIVSHLVWIYKGTVVAITNKHLVTAKNIQAILSGQQVNLPVKRDLLAFDFDKPFFNVEPAQGDNESGLLYYSAFRGYIEGIDAVGKSIMVDSANNTIRLHIANRSILNMYGNAWGVVNPKVPIMLQSITIFEVKDPSRYEYKPGYGKREEWEQKNEICYESVMPLHVGKIGAYKKLINDLNHFFGLNGRWEEREIPCYTIVKVKSDEEIQAIREQESKYTYIGVSGRYHKGKDTKDEISKMEMCLKDLSSYYSHTNLPLVDKSQYSDPIIINYNGEEQNIEKVKKALQDIGFDIIESKSVMNVFVLTEIN